jgi:Fe-S-cluster containining protein
MIIKSNQKKNRAMRKVSAKYHTYREEILSHYTCPTECGGTCCRYSSIRFTREEYPNILQNVDAVSRELIESNAEEIPTNNPFCLKEHGKEAVELCALDEYAIELKRCPLQKGSQCSIYQNRPHICKHYPFENNDYGTTLRICPLGLEIYLDYVNFSESLDFETSHLDIMKHVNSNKKVNPRDFGAVLLIDTLRAFPKFAKYLKCKSLEQIQADRMNLINKCKREYGKVKPINTRFL